MPTKKKKKKKVSRVTKKKAARTARSKKKKQKSTAKKAAAARPATRYGSFDELMHGVAENIRALSYEARKMILSVHPDATEVVRLGDRGATYGLGPAKMSEAHTYIIPQKDYLNLGFFYGTSLPDPEGLLEGTGANMRHVKVRSSEDLARARPLVEAALAERKAALGR